MNNNKPILLAVEEFKIDLEQTINSLLQKHQLPIYFIEPTFTNIANQIKMQAQYEVEQARKQYEEEVKKENET